MSDMYLEFLATDGKGTGGKVRVYYEESYDSATNTSTVNITSIQVSVANHANEFWPNGELKINGETVLTIKSTTPTAIVDINSVNEWYTIVRASDKSTIITATAQIVHDHEGSKLVTVELTNRSDITTTGFRFYTDDQTDPEYGWCVNGSQTITLAAVNPDEPLVIPTSAYGKKSYLFGSTKLPRIPARDKVAYPRLFIRYHVTDGNGFFTLVAHNVAGVVENGIFTAGGDTFSSLSWIIAADLVGDSVLQNTYTKDVGSEWYICGESESIQLAVDNVIWTNSTIYNVDGSAYFEASKGIWLIDLKRWIFGFVSGLAGEPRLSSLKEQTPTAYLYNGVRLPPLPEWDKEAYPYAIMEHTKSASYNIAYVTVAAQLTTEIIFTGEIVRVHGKSSYYHMSWYDEDGFPVQWDEPVVSENDYNTPLSSIMWSNFDIYHQDGTIYLAASEPVPVYE